MHVLSDANGLPLRVAANAHDSQALKPMLSHFHMGHESHPSAAKPRRLHGGKAYDVPHLRRWLRGKRDRRPNRPQGHRLQRTARQRRWVIERTMPWLTGYRQLSHRHERQPGNCLAFLGMAALCCGCRGGRSYMPRSWPEPCSPDARRQS
ncbi:transposase [Streptomyces sp. NPDC003038]|uniref:transposase n=1 Tax=unclassified Streptomyces TaxID=2593676 RepID=UPI0033AE2845